MSEEQEIQEHFGLDGEELPEDPDNPEEPEPEPSDQDDPDGEPEPEPEKELPKGFMTKEAWVEAGKDPDEWVSPEVFKERTQRIQAESRLKREIRQREEEFENRLKNVNLLAQAQLKRQREELLSRRDDLIEVADKDGVRKLDKELSDLDKHADLVSEREEEKQQNKPPEVVEWEQENPWCMDPKDPRTAVVQQAFKEAQDAGKTIAGALRAADKALAEHKAPETKGKKTPMQMADSSKSVANSKNDSPSISWNQLSSEEATMYEEFFEPTGMTKKDYLKTVADQRKGA